METTWILIAHRSGARLFAHNGRGTGLTLVKDIAHPQGRLKNQALDADNPGRSFDRFGQGRHAMSRENEPTAQIADRFAKQLAELLQDGAARRQYAKLVLAAEPGFLGALRANLSRQTADKVIASLDKDLAQVRDQDLPAILPTSSDYNFKRGRVFYATFLSADPTTGRSSRWSRAP